jgi:hypothetical protein
MRLLRRAVMIMIMMMMMTMMMILMIIMMMTVMLIITRMHDACCWCLANLTKTPLSGSTCHFQALDTRVTCHLLPL